MEKNPLISGQMGPLAGRFLQQVWGIRIIPCVWDSPWYGSTIGLKSTMSMGSTRVIWDTPWVWGSPWLRELLGLSAREERFYKDTQEEEGKIYRSMTYELCRM